MQFRLAFGYLLSQTGGFVNLILITACQFIPLVGPIALLGYKAEMSVALDRDPDMRRHPKFDFSRFGEYIVRGVWPFLISLVNGMLHVPVLIGIALITLALNPPGQNNPPVVGFIILFLAEMLAISILQMLSVPMMFHAEITGRLDLRGAARFTMDFWKLVGLVTVGTGFVYICFSFIVIVLGLLCCFVGVYPATALVQMAGQHLTVQLYRVYLNRGGEPLPEREPHYSYDDEEYDDEYEDAREDDRKHDELR